MSKTTKETRITIRVDEELKNAIKTALNSQGEEISLSWLVRCLLRDWIAYRPNKEESEEDTPLNETKHK